MALSAEGPDTAKDDEGENSADGNPDALVADSAGNGAFWFGYLDNIGHHVEGGSTNGSRDVAVLRGERSTNLR